MPGDTDTIVAIATPSGKGGVSIVRLSGSLSLSIAKSVLGFLPDPRHAYYGGFFDTNKALIDQGVSIFFPGPNSFTGEDVIEFQAHGGPFVVDTLINEVISCGARIARPGEFSERAFLNDKIDLAQAEAIADLIDSQSYMASRFALRSLQGEFSRLIDSLVDAVIELRVYIEAAIDFPEEEIDFLATGHVKEKLLQLQQRLDEIIQQANQGRIMKEGYTVVIAGQPNAGKSSLLNTLSGQSSAIVTDIPGTTRDILHEHINIDGMPLHVIDTAGLRDSEDIVEKEGIKRAWKEIEKADLVMLLVDDSNQGDRLDQSLLSELLENLSNKDQLCMVRNKIDLLNKSPQIIENKTSGITEISISAKTGDGIMLLKDYLKKSAGFHVNEEGGFIARRRHIDALKKAEISLQNAMSQLIESSAGELVAEDLRHTQHALSEITGKFTSDDLLGEIFSSFCIGK